MSYIKEKIKENKNIISNFSYLSILQIFMMLSPLITYPYLLKTVGLSLYGESVFGQTLAGYIGLVISFGFETVGAKEISINYNNKIKISEIVSSILFAKLFLWIISLILVIIAILVIPFFSDNKLLYIFSFTICFNELLSFFWFFQGMEKMRFITIVNLISRTVFILLTFILVKTSEDYVYIPLINGLGYLLSGIISFFIMFKYFDVRIIIPTYEKIIYYFKESFLFFLSGGFVFIKERTNALILGSCIGMSELAIYDFGLKVITMLKYPIVISGDCLFPKIARENNLVFGNKAMKIMFTASIFIYLALIVFQDYIAYFFGGNNLSDIGYLFPLMGLYLPLTVIAVYARFGLVLHLPKEYKNSLLYSTIIYLVSIVFLYLLNMISIYTLIISFELSLAFEAFYRLYYVHKLLNKN